MRLLELDRVRHGEESGNIPRALLLVTGDEGVPLAPSPANRQGLHPGVMLRADVEECCALGRAEPFVQVARVDIRTQRLEVQRQMPRHMRSVDDRQDAGLPGPGADRL